MQCGSFKGMVIFVCRLAISRWYPLHRRLENAGLTTKAHVHDPEAPGSTRDLFVPLASQHMSLLVMISPFNNEKADDKKRRRQRY